MGDARAIGRGVFKVSHLLRIRDTSCLARSQTLFILLRLAGHDPVVRIGTPLEPTRENPAHAWVEVDGEPIGEAPGFRDRLIVFDDPVLG